VLPAGASDGDAFFVVVDADTVWLEDVEFVKLAESSSGSEPSGSSEANSACGDASSSSPGLGAAVGAAERTAAASTVCLAQQWQALLSFYGVGDLPVGNSHMRSSADLHRYDDFVETLALSGPTSGSTSGGLTKRRRCFETAVVHFTVLQRKIVDDLIARVEEAAIISSPATAEPAAGSHFTPEEKKGNLAAEVMAAADQRPCVDRPQFWDCVRALSRNGVPVSEYELYFAFCFKYHRSSVEPRQLAFAVTHDWRQWVASNHSQGAVGDDACKCGARVTYVVSHSHLRDDKTLGSRDLAEREGVINAKHHHSSCQQHNHGTREGPAQRNQAGGGDQADSLAGIQCLEGKKVHVSPEKQQQRKAEKEKLRLLQRILESQGALNSFF
jgi:hypothetical protein